MSKVHRKVTRILVGRIGVAGAFCRRTIKHTAKLTDCEADITCKNCLKTIDKTTAGKEWSDEQAWNLFLTT